MRKFPNKEKSSCGGGGFCVDFCISKSSLPRRAGSLPSKINFYLTSQQRPNSSFEVANSRQYEIVRPFSKCILILTTNLMLFTF
ncbi:hypothetical protein CEXT_500211 [Caerostris extrusa]|uniref:Uncharacterized protein n=1 Tax=Caerostris extrusa TaxID=172846 RepID=A0AAV4V712_CAEEX|nr:hypothetical protein CEXT_500211 [Caerostris extrusa]